MVIVFLMGSGSLYAVSNSKTLSVFEVMVTMSKKEMIESTFDLSNLNVFISGMGYSYKVFYPLVCVIPYLLFYRRERVDSFSRIKDIRASKKEMIISYYMTAIISASLALIVADLIYGGIVWFGFPSVASFPKESILPNDSIGILILKNLGKFFLAGSLWASIVYLINEVISNIYIVSVFPFLIKYIWDSIMSRFFIGQSITQKQLRIYSFFNSNSVFTVFDTGMDGLITLAGIIVIDAILFELAVMFIKRRLEYAE